MEEERENKEIRGYRNKERRENRDVKDTYGKGERGRV